METPKNIKELRDQMLEMFAQAKADPRRSVQCDACANMAGKILGSVKMELEDCAQRAVEPNIEFLKYGQKEISIPRRGQIAAGN